MDNDEEPIHVLSLGAGVQSSTMALMAAKGEITPMPVAAIFADTKGEPANVYNYLSFLEEALPFPIIKVSAKDGLTAHIEKGISEGTFIGVPFYQNKGNSSGVGRRQCTREYKITPIAKQIRELVGLKPRQRSKGIIRATLSIGISLDEIQRMKESRENWYVHRFPLIEKRMKRYECLQWMKDNGYPEPPRSACWYCPFHNAHEWRKMRDEDPVYFQKAIDMDKRLRESGDKGTQIFMHPSCVPLDEVDLSTDEDKGQLTWDFNSECEGMCGV
jgi:hypothetical protein